MFNSDRANRIRNPFLSSQWFRPLDFLVHKTFGSQYFLCFAANSDCNELTLSFLSLFFCWGGGWKAPPPKKRPYILYEEQKGEPLKKTRTSSKGKDKEFPQKHTKESNSEGQGNSDRSTLNRE